MRALLIPALLASAAGCVTGPRGPLVDGRTRVLVHQGGRTIGGAEGLIALGVGILEMDVRLTRDGHAVILHDATVDRTTDGRGAVAAMTLEELRRLDAGVKSGRPGERVPTVAELLAAVRGRAWVTLELKVPAAAERTVEAIRDADAFAWTAVRSPDLALLAGLKRAEPRLRTGAMAAGPAAVDRLSALGIDACTAASNAALTREDVARCRAAGIAVWATLCNEEAEMRRLAALGVDGIITDAPELLLRVLRD